ncbi:MAG: tRNA preQ1(34) S-adenosylmethionine ribosyltransferase-isomerase QueA [Gammaproteobacteria bacterium]|nr:MAG: tRNA preQ1(34) S-adenosylmethionine ribosyltransferase-isomerase QueA [Gammaproteobacteria bacterium]PIE37276.1 MAG: tRNA preQ1(34) S-adenosylmethionine ribosyltransferase-isomerase QueA [Gammaproteobacteria bacterium]
MSADDTFSLSDYRFDLPPELIAQQPLAERSASRLLQLGRGGTITHHRFTDLPALLRPGDHLIFNDTRVIPARLFGRKESGGRIEFMLERIEPDGKVVAQLKASRSPGIGSRILLFGGERTGSGRTGSEPDHTDDDAIEGQSGSTREECPATVVDRDGGMFVLEGDPRNPLAAFIDRHGALPLPPYIERPPDARDAERYQTIYARASGAVAAPTAGLHFDDALLERLGEIGIGHSFVTLHVGAGTFQPVRVANPEEHVMHAERARLPPETVAAIETARARGGRIIAVGTTSVRTLESAAQAAGGTLAPFDAETRLFLRPGSRFHVVDGMITNFHLPESTLLMLVAAFAGFEETLAAYREAVRERYRFFSYGDAMLAWCGSAPHRTMPR